MYRAKQVSQTGRPHSMCWGKHSFDTTFHTLYIYCTCVDTLKFSRVSLYLRKFIGNWSESEERYVVATIKTGNTMYAVPSLQVADTLERATGGGQPKVQQVL